MSLIEERRMGMFEKVRRLAEKVATGSSRRGFLSRVSWSALSLAAAIGGFLAFPTPAQAGGGARCCNKKGRCSPPKGKKGCTLINDCNVVNGVSFCVWLCTDGQHSTECATV